MSNKPTPDQDIDQGTVTPEETPATDVQGASQEPNIDQVIADTIAKTKESLKSELAGLNRKVSELEKKNSDLEMAKLSDEERMKAEMEAAQSERDRLLAEADALKRSRMVETELNNAGLSIEFAKRIIGTTPEEISADVAALNDFITTQVNEKIENEVSRRLSGAAPQGGGSPEQNDLKSLHAKALKEGRMDTAIAIKRQANNQGIKL